MALIDYNLRYELPFKDIDGNQWRVHIYDRDNAGSVERLKGTGDPVSIYYEGDEEFTKGIIGSSCAIRLYGTPNMDGTSDLSQFFTSDEERFYVKVEYTSDGVNYLTYWTGFLHQDEYIENITSDPYMVELIALDRLGTIKTKGHMLGWQADTALSLGIIVDTFSNETKLELTSEFSTGMLTENGQNLGFLRDQFVWGETFLDGDDEWVQMISISEVVSNLALSLNCRVWQEAGKLKFKSIKPQLAETPKWSLPQTITQIDDNLYARHLPARRVTNISIQTKGKNQFQNASFEEDALLSPTVTHWFKPAANTAASIEVSDEAVDSGSNQSLKTINNRISDSTFEGASLSTKLNAYTLLETESKNISFGVLDELQGILKIKFFVNNTNPSNYELRFSMERNNNLEDKYYDFSAGNWTSSFKYSFFNAESTGEWQEIEIPFVMFGDNFYNTGANTSGDEPITFRMHTMNYDDSGSLSNVQVFFDNMQLKVYNADGDARTAFLPETRFYNLSTDDDTSVKTGSIDIDLNMGITTAETRIDALLSNKFYLMDTKVLGQFVNLNTENPEDVGFNDTVSPSYIPLSVLLMELRRELDESSKRVYSTTLATKKGAGWEPIMFGDRWFINYTGHSSGTLGFTRFDIDVKGNRYRIDAIKLP